MAIARVEKFTGVQKLAPEHIEKNEVEQALRAAQFTYDRLIHDLRSEFIAREAKLRDAYLAETREIMGAAG